MKIGLMGCEFVSPNKGCEALTYSLLKILNDIKEIEDNTVIYNFSGTDLGEIPNSYKRFSFINVTPSLRDIKFTYLRAIKNCDLILDVTMGDSFSDIYSKVYYNLLVRNKNITQKLCKNFILLPQTYGPFSDANSAKKAKKIIKNATKVYCRDKMSQDLLINEFGVSNSILTTDLAFFLQYNKSKYKLNKSKKIGINISGLLYKGGFESTNQFDLKMDYKKYIDMILDRYSNSKEYEVHLIPHVIDKSINSYDDDYKISKKLQEKYKNCILAPVFENPIDAKSYISNMDIFIGSRMHSTIAAFSSGVVTIPVSYSRKFEGLYNSFGYEYVINGRMETTEKAIDKTVYYINNNQKLKLSQKKCNQIIEEKKEVFLNDIKNYFKRSR